MNPTSLPTTSPSYDPTVYPSTHPTVTPTVDPTSNPSDIPSVSPSNNPTKNPNIAPTMDPTQYPSHNPTNDPSIEPTFGPSMEPTIYPTIQPTAEPTVKQPSILTIDKTEPTSPTLSIDFTTTIDLKDGKVDEIPAGNGEDGGIVIKYLRDNTMIMYIGIAVIALVLCCVVANAYFCYTQSQLKKQITRLQSVQSVQSENNKKKIEEKNEMKPDKINETENKSHHLVHLQSISIQSGDDDILDDMNIPLPHENYEKETMEGGGELKQYVNNNGDTLKSDSDDEDSVEFMNRLQSPTQD